MPEFANLLRQRLASGAAPWVRAEASHPDADTLTAYVEQLLPASERAQILEHVAACGHCREVVALAMSPPELDGLDAAQVAVIAPASPRRRFFSWNPRLGFAASMAILAVAATVVLVMPKKAPAPVEQAKNDTTAAPAGVPPASAVQPADALPTASGESLAPRATRTPTAGSSTLRLSPRREAPTADRLALASPVDSNGAFASIASPNNHVAGITEAYDRVTTERGRDYLKNDILAANTTFSVDGQPADVSVITTPNSNQDLFQKSLRKVPIPFSDLPPPSQDVKTGHLSAAPSRFGWVIVGSVGREARQVLHGRISPPIPPNITGFAAMGPASQLSPPKEKNQTAEIPAAPATAEKNANDLDQSGAFIFNSRAKAETSAAKADKRAESSPVSWKTDGGQLFKCVSATACVEGYPSNEGITFSIVKSRSSEIWAGGNDAALVHSSDGGVTWDRITLGASAKGTITSIDARGPNIQVRSSSGQGWSSLDGGKSWTLQE